MKIILMVNETKSAERIREVGIEQWLRDHRESPTVMVVNREQGGVSEELLLEPKGPPCQGPVDDAHAIEAIAQGPVTLYPRFRRALVNGRQVHLKNKEYELLQYLVQQAGEVFSRERLYREIWGDNSQGNPATITVHINRIRKKIEQDPSRPLLIKTVHGMGYYFHTPQAQESVNTLSTT